MAKNMKYPYPFRIPDEVKGKVEQSSQTGGIKKLYVFLIPVCFLALISIVLISKSWKKEDTDGGEAGSISLVESLEGMTTSSTLSTGDSTTPLDSAGSEPDNNTDSSELGQESSSVGTTDSIISSDDNLGIVWHDSNVEALIRAETGIQDGSVREEDVANLSELDLSNRNIRDISDLIYLKNISSLNLSGNNIVDIGSLSELYPLSRTQEILVTPFFRQL